MDTFLKEKLNCLVVIQNISRTYCYPNSFVRGHEFNEFAGKPSDGKSGWLGRASDNNLEGIVFSYRSDEPDGAFDFFPEDFPGELNLFSDTNKIKRWERLPLQHFCCVSFQFSFTDRVQSTSFLKNQIF